MREDLQVYSLPVREPDRSEYAHAMGKESWDVLYAEYQSHTSEVSEIFQKLLQTDQEGISLPTGGPRRLRFRMATDSGQAIMYGYPYEVFWGRG